MRFVGIYPTIGFLFFCHTHSSLIFSIQQKDNYFRKANDAFSSVFSKHQTRKFCHSLENQTYACDFIYPCFLSISGIFCLHYQ